jgi:hypothetical protein
MMRAFIIALCACLASCAESDVVREKRKKAEEREFVKNCNELVMKMYPGRHIIGCYTEGQLFTMSSLESGIPCLYFAVQMYITKLILRQWGMMSCWSRGK